MTPLGFELDLESAIELHLILGEDDGRLPKLRRVLREYLYENLSIAELEEIEAARSRGAGPGKRGFA